MESDDFDRLRDLLASRAGFNLARDRLHLVRHRLAPVARRHDFESVDALLAALGSGPAASLTWAVTEAVMNAETWFNRDRAAFALLSTSLLPTMARARDGRPLRLWVAGCATGQEAYSLAMAAREAQVMADILATDLVRASIERARRGVYSGFEIQRGLSVGRMLRWFEPDGDAWRARAELSDGLIFERNNLLDDPVTGDTFDVILCCNVLDDMTPDHRRHVIEILERNLTDDGVLFVGGSTGLQSDSAAFRPIAGRSGVLVKAGRLSRRAA